jgi:hypothetical protein
MPRSPASSAAAVYEVTQQARATGIFGAVEAGFLDQSPEVGEVVAAMPHRRIVLVPFFIAAGVVMPVRTRRTETTGTWNAAHPRPVSASARSSSS